MKAITKKPHKGIFITFEGVDGSGKTTIINMVYKNLFEKYANKVVLTREPGGKNNPIAEDIREIVLNKIEYNITPLTEMLLFAASRAQHVHDFIQPHLANNEIVLCDRFIHSSLIYQGYARKLGFEKVKEINNLAIDGTYPDLTFILMVAPEVGLERIKTNTREANRIDREAIDLHKSVYNGYLKMLEQEPKNSFCVIDASKNIDEVFKDVIVTIEKFIALKKW